MRKKIKLNFIIISFIGLISLIILIEIILRITIGLGNPLIYIPDDKIGYLIKPNQQIKRNGNLIQINEYSMRSNPLKKTINEKDLRVFLIGDSIANGGWWTNQNKTLSALLEQELKVKYSNQFKDIEVLNASANSWSPRNELEYLKKFGTFQSQIMILLINTDDFFGLKPSSLKVGNDPNYWNKKPFLALQELWIKLIPNKDNNILKNIPKETGDLVDKNLNSISKIKAIAIKNKAKLILAITPLKREIIPPYSKDYEKEARQRLEELTNNENIIYIDFLPIFQAQENPESLYHDHIHLNQKGYQVLKEILIKKL